MNTIQPFSFRLVIIPKSRPNTCFICALPVTKHINATSAPGVGYVHPYKSSCSILTDLIVETGPSSMPDISWDYVIDFYDSFKFQFPVPLQNPEHIKLSEVMQVAEFLQEQHKDPFVFGHPLPPPHHHLKLCPRLQVHCQFRLLCQTGHLSL